jgi:hypothetical protein
LGLNHSSKLSTRAIFVAGIALVVFNRVLIAAKIRRRPDGWRRGAGLVLRDSASKFVLSAFGLNIWSDVLPPNPASAKETEEHLAARLANFLAGEKEMHRRVRRTRDADLIENLSRPSYSLRFEPWIDGPGRFARPEFWNSPAAKPHESIDDLLDFVCRIDSAGRADVWVRANHVGIDGVPVQEMLSRLEAAWGSASQIIFPTGAEFAPHATARTFPGRDGLVEIQTFIDFAPLVAWRKKENAILPEPMTLSAAILWSLARLPEFSRIIAGSTVEIPPADGLDRCVGVVVVRPGDYLDRPNGLRDYVRDFNRQVNRTRQRRSLGCKTLDAAALIPAKIETHLLRQALDQGGWAFGGMALSIIRDAKIFGAPIADTGQASGFIALGSITLPTRDGRQVGCVTIKGPINRIQDYPALLEKAISSLSAESFGGASKRNSN